MREAAFTSAVWADMLQAQNPKFVKTGKIRTQLHPHVRLSRTAHLHRLITFHNQSTDISASEGRPLADFRRIGEHSDCFTNTVWALCASLFVKQSIGGAARQENQQVASGSGDIALDMKDLPCANGRSETLKPNLAVGILSRWPGKWCTYNPKNRNFKK